MSSHADDFKEGKREGLALGGWRDWWS